LFVVARKRGKFGMIVARHTVVKIFLAAKTIHALKYVPVMRIRSLDRLAEFAGILVARVRSDTRKLQAPPNGFEEYAVFTVIMLLTLYLYQFIG
jgi:hypothetical protein